MSIYQANGIIANLRHCAEVVFSIPDVRNISKEKYDTWIRLLNSGLDEVGILRRELNKQRKIMPIRRLFNAIPNLLLTLKSLIF